jgi:DNA-binding NarL/FixJ family response regulator
MIHILIADNEALVRGGLRMILEAQPDLEVVGEAVDGNDAVDQARTLRPDLVLMDIRMPDLDGLEATRLLLSGADPVPKVLVLTTFDLDEYVYKAISAGASGFLLKSAAPHQLVHGVRAVASGDALLAPEITRRLLDRFVRRPPPSNHIPPELAELTQRELDVLQHIANGYSNAEIARALYLSEATIKTHITHLLSKLQLRDRVQAVVLAYRTGLMDGVDGPPQVES